ncbi:MAG: hypothetical protein AB7G06_01825 [Bdellovibrionales bacterium]
MKYIFALLMLLIAGLNAQAGTPPPGNIYNVPPFNAAQLFTSVPCGNAFDCRASITQEQVLALANQCATTRLGFPEGMLTLFENEGTYEKCALPESYAPKGPGLGASTQWPICCIDDKGNGKCELSCHFYRGGSGEAPAYAQ